MDSPIKLQGEFNVLQTNYSVDVPAKTKHSSVRSSHDMAQLNLTPRNPPHDTFGNVKLTTVTEKRKRVKKTYQVKRFKKLMRHSVSPNISVSPRK